ncbi:MAG: hypothetical protein KAJ19_19400, partial [Gammaproteobacteria bacterium]|nr:hypothetical protein [Gammaproteobacteria bacterium]
IEKQSPRVFRIDLLADLEELPTTMLVIAEAEALLMPAGTDAAKLDPRTAETDESNTATLFSNPIRVNFETEAPAP